MDKKNFVKSAKSLIWEAFETAVFVIFMVIVIRFFLGEIRWIPSGSMHPTLLEGDRIFVEKLVEFFKEPKRGEVWVFYPPMEEVSQKPYDIFRRLTGFYCKDIAYIKRVIGLPGDKVEIKSAPDGRYDVYINDEKLKEDYILDAYDYVPCMKGMFCGPFTVPKDSYFMMGDNRGNSQDSRFWGFLKKDRLVGRAVFVFWPITRMHGI